MASSYPTIQLQRMEIPYLEGVNISVDDNLSKKSELYRCENARSEKIGTIEKRRDKQRIGNSLSATANYHLFYFVDENSLSKKMYRISTVGGSTIIYYLNTSSIWTALTDGDGIHMLEVGDSTSQFDITNTGGSTYRYTWDTTGTDPDIDAHMRVGSTVVINAQNFSAVNKGTFTVTGVSTNYFEITNASGSAENNKTIGTGSIVVTVEKFHGVSAEGCYFFVNGHTDNRYIRYIASDGLTVTSSVTAAGHLYNCPKAHLINFYKDRLYVGDYIVSSTRYKTGVMMSSRPLGILSLVDGDHATGVTTVQVTDTKYIQNTDSLDVYRGGTNILTLTVSAKTEDSLIVTATGAPLQSSDELWVAGTYTGTKKFRWASNPASGEDVKQYDTFKLSGGDNDELTMMTNIGDVMVIANKRNMAIWNDYNLQTFDYGIGCVSKQGYVKHKGVLFFIDYSGMYATTGARPQLMSAKVEDYFRGATKAGLEAARMGKYNMSVFAYIGTVTLYKSDGSVERTLSDVVMEYNLRQENWFVHTGIKADQFETYIESSNTDRLLFTMNDSGGGDYEVYELFYKETDLLIDAEINFSITTQEIYLPKEIEKYAYPKAVIVEIKRGGGIECYMSLDGGEFYALEDEAMKGINVLKITPRSYDEGMGKCHTIRLSFREYSNRICKIGRIALLYSLTEEEKESVKENG